MKIFRYMRYSSHNQTETSIECQDITTRKYCQEKGYEIVKDYIDRSYTGTNDQRPDFQQMIEDIKSGADCDAVLVYDLSRYSRSVEDAFHYKKILTDNNVMLLSALENIDPNDKFANYNHFYTFCKNEDFSKDLSIKTTDGLKNKARKAGTCGGIPPLGYDVDSDGVYILNKDEAEIVEKIFNLFEQGRSYQQMADILNDDGFTTKVGKPFTKNSFLSILSQEKYTGTYVYNRAPHKDKRGRRNNHASKPEEEQIKVENGCPVIIKKEQFNRIQSLLKDRANGKAASKSKEHYMLGGMGILHCAECGRAMVGKKVGSHGSYYTVYSCPNHKAKQCSTKDIKCSVIDDFVSKAIIKTFYPKRLLDDINRSLLKANPNKELTQKKTKLKKANQRLTRALKTSYSDSVAKEITKNEQELRKIEKKISESKILDPLNHKTLVRARHKLAKYLQVSDSYHAKQLIKETVKDVLINNEGIKLILDN